MGIARQKSSIIHVSTGHGRENIKIRAGLK